MIAVGAPSENLCYSCDHTFHSAANFGQCYNNLAFNY